MIQQKSIITSILLAIFTCGIYALIWTISIVNDVKTVSEDQSLPDGGMAVLLTIVTCGLYGFYLWYKLAAAMMVANEKYGFPKTDNTALYLILMLFGLGIVNYAVIQDELNKIADVSE